MVDKYTMVVVVRVVGQKKFVCNYYALFVLFTVLGRECGYNHVHLSEVHHHVFRASGARPRDYRKCV
jgi:hypothetical protein